MGLIQECDKYFSTKDLYEVLRLQRSASLLDIKKAYKKASLLIHPDRVEAEAKGEATRKFQILAKVHSILSDGEKRAAYDETGVIDEENNISENDSPEFWKNYWHNLFPKLTVKDIDDFFTTYKGSDEEMRDLKECYVKYEGDMNLIAECFLGYHVDEEDRIKNILTELIRKEEIPPFPKFVKEPKAKKAARVKRLKSEAKEAAKIKEEIDSDLMKAMSRRVQDREAGFNSMIQNLEAKYGAKEAKTKRRKH